MRLPPAGKSTNIRRIVGWCLVVGLILLPCVCQFLYLDHGRESARRSQSKNNLVQIGMGFNADSETTQALMPGGTFTPAGEGLHGWMTALLPYLGQGQLHSRIDLKSPWNSPSNNPVFHTRVSGYLNPLLNTPANADKFAPAHYAGNVHVLLKNKGLAMSEITDGASSTILAGEVAENFSPWGAPDNVRDPALGLDGPVHFGCPAGNECRILLLDGTVRVIHKSIDPLVLKALATPSGGEPVPETP